VPARKPTRSTPKPRPSSSGPSTTHRLVKPADGAPIIVLDPGHSPSISGVDPATGLDVSTFENEPEMHDVFAVAELVKQQLQAAGYRVLMTKSSVMDRVNLGQRVAITDQAHAALALSIHDQAGSNGGIGFDAGNNIVYYQSVGTYRVNTSGTRIYFTDAKLAAVSAKCGQIFRDERSRVEDHSISLMGNTGYDLGSRGLPAGNTWREQLLSRIPWIYNEAGGNSAGMSGLDASDKQRYANGLVAAVEHCIPLSR
jgi:N-acetylmuramoyl-L-alanine amidase